MACGCGSKVCSCALVAGSNVTISGTGTTSNPYVISASGGGGGGAVTTTVAGLNALATAGSLVVGTKYVVTDWVSGSGSLPGPNIIVVDALNAHTPSPFVQVRTPLGDAGPCDGRFLWNYSGSINLMTFLRDTFNNEIYDVGSGAIDSFVWGNSNWTGNLIAGDGAFGSAYAANAAAATAGLQFSNNRFLPGDAGGTIDVTGCTGGQIRDNIVSGSGLLSITTGAATIHVVACEVATGSNLSVTGGGSADNCRTSCGGGLGVGTFAASGVIVDGGFSKTLTANNTNTLKNAGFDNIV